MLRKYEHPSELLDPAGEGIYILIDPARVGFFDSPYHRAAPWFFADRRRWRDVDVEDFWMGPGPDGETYVKRRFRWWHGFLPESRWPVAIYGYYTPKPEAM